MVYERLFRYPLSDEKVAFIIKWKKEEGFFTNYWPFKINTTGKYKDGYRVTDLRKN